MLANFKFYKNYFPGSVVLQIRANRGSARHAASSCTFVMYIFSINFVGKAAKSTKTVVVEQDDNETVAKEICNGEQGE